MQPKDKGFVKIPRCVFSSDIWEERRVFSRFEAIADIYQAADYKSRKLTISFRMLADRWGWCVGKVQRLFATLSKKGMITVVTDGKSTTITVTDTLSDTPTDTPNDTVKRPSTKGLQDTTDTPNDTHTDTPSDTPRAYKNDNINISCLSNDSSLRSESTLEEEKDSSLRSESTKSDNNDFSFDKFWDLYDKKVGKDKAITLYANLSRKDKEAIFKHVPLYKMANPDKKYRKDPQTYLRNHSWNDEIITSKDDTRLLDNNTGKFKGGFSWK